MPAISDSMPVKFKNGALFTEISGYCINCNKLIEPDLLRGSVIYPFDSVAIVDAVGVCHECNLISGFYWRLHNDMRITGQRDGKWYTWRPQYSFHDQLINFIKGIFSYGSNK